MDLLLFTALGWLGLGFIAAGVLRARRPTRFEALGRVFLPAAIVADCPGTLNAAGESTESPPPG